MTRRSVQNRAMERLPFVDEHSVEIEAGTEAVWRSLIGNFGNAQPGFFDSYARLIGCDPLGSSGPLDVVGSTRTGFRVAEVIDGRLLVLTGRHRFSRYALTWTVSPLAEGRSSLTARTDAAFPGVHGGAYRALVITSGAHARVTRGMLASIARHAV